MKNKILFIYTGRSSFVKKDIEILSQKYIVDEFAFIAFPKWKTPFLLLKQFFLLLFKGKSYSLMITQFAGYHSYLPALLGKLYNTTVLIICGGTESAGFPSISYGNFNKKWLGLFTKWSINMATHLAPKHQSLIHFKYDYDDKDYPEQGLQFFIRNFNTPYTIIENGYDASKFRCIAAKKKNSFVTVAAGIGTSNIIPLKGIDLIIDAAPHFSDCSFYLVGVPIDFKMQLKSSNVICLPQLKNEELIKLYSEAEFYLQLSMSEGFPNAICEAMLCEGIPIASNVNALPDIVDNAGFILSRRNNDQLKQIIATALRSDKNLLRLKARKHIADNFSIEKRASKILNLVDLLIEKKQ
ncbi:MAG: glycosyltransferase family 4 protein [Bacteroidia bacterium]